MTFIYAYIGLEPHPNDKLTALNLNDCLELLADDQSKRLSNYSNNNYKVKQRVHKKDKQKSQFIWEEDK